jgi:hypothetical protein
MAINQEFLGRLDREIASLKTRIASQQQDAASGRLSPEEINDVRGLESQLEHLEDIRLKLIAQSSGG